MLAPDVTLLPVRGGRGVEWHERREHPLTISLTARVGEDVFYAKLPDQITGFELVNWQGQVWGYRRLSRDGCGFAVS